MLVEAAAGTGKTTSMIGRMVELLANGNCKIDTLAAVTFTRKAAAEIRGRFQIAIEKAVTDCKGEAADRLGEALAHIDRCFIGTIHSFCGRLLRERPVEAGVEIGFSELDDVADDRLRNTAWNEYIDSLVTHKSPATEQAEIATALADAGIEVTMLRDAFLRLCDFPDVGQWPEPTQKMPSADDARQALDKYARHLKTIMPFENIGNDALMPKLNIIARMVRVLDLRYERNVAIILEIFTRTKTPKVIHKSWPDRKEQALSEQQGWEMFRDQIAVPFLDAWREYRYGIVLRAIRPAIALYEKRLRMEGALNFQDLLLLSARLLKKGPSIRRYFQHCFTHLLVDEFQDTDPIQAEVMLLLTADDVTENCWQNCRPLPGSLFVVGDPKQSIYRFRRADIVTYRRVKKIIAESGGRIVPLSTNFRSEPYLIDWVNGQFIDVFGQEETDQIPQFVPMQAGRNASGGKHLAGLHRLAVPKFRNQLEATEYEADLIARTIHQAISERWELPGDDGTLRGARAEDFMIITRKKKFLSHYGRKLQELDIAHQVTGGYSLIGVVELRLLTICLRALARVEDPIALIAVLRSELFGVSDTALYAWKEAGGQFLLQEALPDRLAEKDRATIGEPLARLNRYSSWLRQLPMVTAIERIARDLGLPARAATAADGAMRAGGLLGAIEKLRNDRKQIWNLEAVTETLDELCAGNEEADGVPVMPRTEQPVRIMNLHKAKGLEANIIFLAGVQDEKVYDAELHIDRTEGETRGFFAIHAARTSKRGPRSLLAQPADWEQHAAQESLFLRAERDRLAYVAATRARSGLVVTCLDGKIGSWDFFEPAGDTFLPLATPPAAHKSKAPPRAEQNDPDAAAAAAARAWQEVTVPTYDVVAAKAHALDKETTLPPPQHTGEHGTEWGTAIHTLLEAAMENPAAELAPLGRSVLEQQNLDPGLLESLLESVARAIGSPIWRRAQESSERLVEAPFSYLACEDGFDTVVRGVIDLAFREQDGWVLVDYKSDQAGKDSEKASQLLAARYAAQLAAYAEAWSKVTGERVVEQGLLLTHYDKYVSLP